jgi:hypothetical protein
MKKQLVSIAPLKAGIILGILYGLLALIIVPFFLLFVLIGAKTNSSGSPGAAIFGVGFAIMLPVFYAIIGFIFGIIAAAIYNLIAKWTGGFEFEVRDIPPAY